MSAAMEAISALPDDGDNVLLLNNSRENATNASRPVPIAPEAWHCKSSRRWVSAH